MKNVSLMIAALLFLGLYFANAQAVSDNFKEQYSSTFYNCNADELVDVNGTIHVVQKNNGTYHFNVHAFGIGENSGSRYVLNYVENFMPTSNQGTWSTTIVLNGQGKTPDFKIKIIAHYTVNANGRVVVDFFNVEDNCD